VCVADEMALYVGRLPFSVSPREVERLFEKHGRITRCNVKKGFGFVEFSHNKDAEDAIKELDGHEFQGEKIVVEWAKTKPGVQG
jgi:RNA recognition motif-containing protein